MGKALFDNSRRIVWFSCGAASACAAKVTVEKYGDMYGEHLLIIYCNTLSTEHADNKRFMADVEKWIGRPIQIISSKKYKDTWDVYHKERWLNGPGGARCTVELKRVPRLEFERPDDIHIFGFTVEEEKRIQRFIQDPYNFEYTEFILRDEGITKKQCYQMLMAAGIELPAMYKLGYHNNNCIGCVKGGMGYWNKIRVDFPEVFARMAKLEREIGASCCGVFLDELDPKAGRFKNEDIECGPICQQPSR